MKKCEIKKKKYEEKFIDLTFERKQGINIHVIDIDWQNIAFWSFFLF